MRLGGAGVLTPPEGETLETVRRDLEAVLSRGEALLDKLRCSAPTDVVPRADYEAQARQIENQKQAILGYRAQIREAFSRVMAVVNEYEDKKRRPPETEVLRGIAMDWLRLRYDPEKSAVRK